MPVRNSLITMSSLLCASAVGVLTSSTLAADHTEDPKIACGSGFSVAITDDGRVIAWGNNGQGQCEVPSGIVNPVRVAAWDHHALVLQADGTIKAWGANTYGQCEVPGDLGTVIDIDSLSRGSLALLADGSLRGWGENYWCGSGTRTLEIPGDLTGVRELGGGNAHWFYRAFDGTISGIGCNYNGQLNIPSAVQPPLDFEANESWSCVLGPDNRLHAMGWGGYGQLNVPSGSDYVDIACGHYFGLALTDSGEVFHWGQNNQGQGDIPVDLGQMDIAAINAGSGFGVAVHPDGSLTMWGANGSGECEWPVGERIRMGDPDCDADGEPDWLEILRGTMNDQDGDGVPDDCGSTECAGPLMVPGDHSTIQAAIGQAIDGCEIIIEPGVYGPVDLMGKSLVLRASDATGEVVIDAEGSARCVQATGSAVVLIDGLVLRNGYVSASGQVGGAGIEASGCDLELHEVTIESCIATRNGSGYFDAEGGAIRMVSGTLSMASCDLRGNQALSYNTGNLYSTGWARGGAIHIENVNATLVECDFVDNLADSISVGNSWHNVHGNGGAVSAVNSTLIVDFSEFTDNRAEVLSQSSGVAAVSCSGGAISADLTSISMNGTSFVNNEVRSTSSTTYYDNAGSGGAVSLGGGASFEARGCTFLGNLVAAGLNVAGTMRGGALHMHVSEGEHRVIMDCLFQDNVLGIDGSNGGRLGGALCTQASDSGLDAMLDIERCLFRNNQGTSGSAVNFGSSGNTVSETVVCGGLEMQVVGDWVDAGGVQIVDECTGCPYDLNLDQKIDGSDLNIVFGWWGTSGATEPSPDLDGDGIVDGRDLNLLLGSWGDNCD
ncbi:MAG: hypothetical protein P8J45_12345 [Phycisphaerales bacterium]|nr:hypothetical protein [Phycisphaerales bacterium]